jgi:hypothetical protein
VCSPLLHLRYSWKVNCANFRYTAYSEVGPIAPEEEGWNVVLSGA